MDDVRVLAQQRQDAILQQVRAQGAVRVADLVSSLDVSDMTVRRDIAELARRGLVQRVHGGAVDAGRAAHTAHEPGFRAKSTLAPAEKSAVARAALQHVTPGSAVALSAGTTTHLLAGLIARDPALRPLTVVTNSLPAAEALHLPDDHELTVVLVGGTRTPSDALVGPIATHGLESLRVDVLFLGVHALDPAGLTTPNLLEAETDRALIASAGHVVVLADHSKWGRTALCRIADLSVVDVLVCDDALPDDAARALGDAVGALVLAPVGTAGATPHPPGEPSRPHVAAEAPTVQRAADIQSAPDTPSTPHTPSTPDTVSTSDTLSTRGAP